MWPRRFELVTCSRAVLNFGGTVVVGSLARAGAPILNMKEKLL